MTIQPYEAREARTPALLNPVTDSWTAVVSDVIRLAEVIAQSEFVPTGLRGSVPKVTAAILHGRELGIPPMSALASVHVISGKAGISAELMRALILQAGHELAVGESTASRCVLKGRRSQLDDWTSVAYTMEEARKAGDAQKNPNYGSRPAEMLLARATTRLARMIFADVIHGMRSVEELQDMGDADAEAPVYVPPTVEQVKVSRQAPPAVESAPAPATMGADAAGAEGGEAAATPPETPASPPQASPQAPPQRRRAPLTRRGGTPKAEPQPEPDPDPEPEPEPEPSEPEPQPERTVEAVNHDLHRKAVTVVVMHFDRIGVSERAERLWATQVLAGRPIKSTNDLSLSEVRDVAKALERIRDREALEKVLSEADSHE